MSYYTLATKGMRYLIDIGLDTDKSFRASKEVDESYLHLRHSLELNDVLIAAPGSSSLSRATTSLATLLSGRSSARRTR